MPRPRTTAVTSGAGHGLVGGAHAEGDDRLAERDDDDQAVPLGEVRRRVQPPSLGPTQVDPDVVHRHGHGPDHQLGRGVEEGTRDEQHCEDRDGHCRPDELQQQAAVVTCGHGVDHQVDDAHEDHGDGERQRAVPAAGDVMERLDDRESGDEQRHHREHHTGPDDALVGLRLVAQPRVGAPGEPQQAQHHDAARDAEPRRVRREQRRHLGEGVDEHEVEEQLQRRDAVRLVGALEPEPLADRHRWSPFRWRRPDARSRVISSRPLTGWAPSAMAASRRSAGRS